MAEFEGANIRESFPQRESAADLMAEIAAQELKKLVPQNTYSENNGYTATHPNATSDGDEKGKDILGSKTDIATRDYSLGLNAYNANNPYSATHPNATSDGDDKGKDELGGKTDITTREAVIKLNQWTPFNNYLSNLPE